MRVADRSVTESRIWPGSGGEEPARNEVASLAQFRDAEGGGGDKPYGGAERNSGYEIHNTAQFDTTKGGRSGVYQGVTGGAHYCRSDADFQHCDEELAAANSTDTAANERKKGQAAEPRYDRSGESQSRMAEADDANESRGDDEVHADRGQAHEHRSSRIAQGIKGGRQQFQGGESSETEGIAGERQCGLMGVEAREMATLEDKPDHAVAEDGKADRRGNREQEGRHERARERIAKLSQVSLGGTAGDAGQHGGPQGDAEEADGKLHEAERIGEPAYGSVDDMARGVANAGREVGVHQQIEMNGSAADECRAHEGEDAADAFVLRVPARPPCEPSTPDRGQLEQKLGDAAANDADRHAFDRADAEPRTEPVTERKPKEDGAEVEYRGGDGGHAKTVAGVQNALRLRREGEQQQKRKHGPGEANGKLPFAGYRVIAGREHVHEPRSKDDAEDDDG